MKRRDFIGRMGVGLASWSVTPAVLNTIAASIVQSLVNKAQAEELNSSFDPRNYVGLQLYGAPPRYVFDQWIRTNPSDPVIQNNESVHTKLNFSNGVLSGSELGHFNYKGLLVPHLFSGYVKMGGLDRPLTDLLNHMLVLRGFGTGREGHAENARRVIQPVGGLPTLAGVIADESSSRFGAVAFPSRGTTGAFASSTGKTLNSVSGSQPLRTLMQGFQEPASGNEKARQLRGARADILNYYQNLLRNISSSQTPGAKIIGQNMKAAQALIKTGLGEVDQYWSEAVSRYSARLLDNLRHYNVEGLGTGALLHQPRFENRLRITFNGSPVMLNRDFDLRNGVANLDLLSDAAAGFALAEYCLTRQLAQSIELRLTGFQNLTLRVEGSAASQMGAVPFDMHETGSFASIFFSSLCFRGLSAMILELSDQLKRVTDQKNRNMWNQTVVHLFAEFCRSARADGSGSDHGYSQMASSILSGAISSPMVVGHVLQSGLDQGNYRGTQGVGASIPGYNQTGMPTPAMMLSTLAEVLRLNHNPYANLAAPLVQLKNDQVEYVRPDWKGKMVVGA